MVKANLEIIDVLQSFLNTVVEDPEIRALFTMSPSDFSRDRKLPLKKLVGMVINLPKRSLSIELKSFFENLNESDLCCTKAAFSLQRTKLKPVFFKVWNDLLVKSYYHFYGDNVKRWEGFRLLAVDGSNCSLPGKAEVLDYYGSADDQFGGVPMGRILQIHDVLNDVTIWGDLFPRQFSENVIINHHIELLLTDSVTLLDRAYPSYCTMYLLENQEIRRHFVMRCKTTFSNAVKDFVSSEQNDLITTIYPSLESIQALRTHGYIVTKETGVEIRMIKVVLPNGQIEVLLTNLFDDKIFTLEKMSKLYFMRWKIETAYSKQKNQMQMEIFSGHRVVCIEQDYAAGLFVANLQSIIEKQCEEEISKIAESRQYAYKINQNISWSSLKNRILKLFIQANDTFTTLMELQHLFLKNIEPLRPNRQIPRRLPKRKRGKYQTFTNYRRAI